MTEARLTGAMRVLSDLLQARTGQFLAESRMWRLETSLKPLLRAHGLATLDDLVDRVLAEGGEPLADAAVDALLNNETSFFRDQHIFLTIIRELLPLIAERRGDRLLRIWSAGCSAGQEAYSLAMMIAKEPETWAGWRIQIVGTDISRSMVARARSGLFSQIDVQRGLAINDLVRWFEPAGDDWRISDQIRRMVDFRVDNLLECTVPSGEYDLILCRNVLLYFSSIMRPRVFAQLARYAAPGGFLLLGAGETVIGHTDEFAASPLCKSVYERVASGRSPAGRENAA